MRPGYLAGYSPFGKQETWTLVPGSDLPKPFAKGASRRWIEARAAELARLKAFQGRLDSLTVIAFKKDIDAYKQQIDGIKALPGFKKYGRKGVRLFGGNHLQLLEELLEAKQRVLDDALAKQTKPAPTSVLKPKETKPAPTSVLKPKAKPTKLEPEPTKPEPKPAIESKQLKTLKASQEKMMQMFQQPPVIQRKPRRGFFARLFSFFS